MAHTYSHLYNIPITCLRFFTVYGPWGRPDMAPMLFAKAITQGKPIKVFNNGEMERDFTFVEDIANGVIKTMLTKFSDDQLYRVLNIGNGSPVNLLDFIKSMEKYLKQDAMREYLPMQAGDVKRTWADQTLFHSTVGYKPAVSIDEGVKVFVDWYQKFYKKKKYCIIIKLLHH